MSLSVSSPMPSAAVRSARRAPIASPFQRQAPADDFRALMSAFPTGVAVVTTVDRDGLPRGLTCSSVASVTTGPPTLSVCVMTGSGTLRAITELGSFAVNLLRAEGRRAAEVFSRPGQDRFSEVRWRHSPDGRLPWLTEDAFASADCRLADTVVVGDHTILIGEVTDIRQTPGTPLLYGLRRFATWPGEGSQYATVPVEQAS